MSPFRKLDVEGITEEDLRKMALRKLHEHFAGLVPVPGREVYFEYGNNGYVATVVGKEGLLEVEFDDNRCMVYPSRVPNMGSGEEAVLSKGLGAMGSVVEDPDAVRAMLRLLFAKAGWANRLDEENLKLTPKL